MGKVQEEENNEKRRRKERKERVCDKFLLSNSVNLCLQLEQHNALCPLAKVSCEFEEAGCTFKVLIVVK